MSDLKLTGKIKLIGEKQTFDSGFQKVEFVITTNDTYPQDVKFEVLKDKVDNFLKYNKIGQDVDVSFNINGSEYKGKYYVNLIAWKVFKADGQSGASTPNKEFEKQTAAPVAEDSGLPF